MNFTNELEFSLREIAEIEVAKGMEAYMKHKFGFLGVKSIARGKVLKKLINDYGLPEDEELEQVVIDLWCSQWREMDYCAQELLQRKKWYKRDNSIRLFEWMITHNSWWDTVDFIATNLCGPYFRSFPSKIETIKRWNQSENIWLVRTSIIFQLKYGSDVDKRRLKEYILPHLQSKEFFIQKAIGWSLRQVSKFDRNFVADFIENHTLKPVSKREATKYL